MLDNLLVDIETFQRIVSAGWSTVCTYISEADHVYNMKHNNRGTGFRDFIVSASIVHHIHKRVIRVNLKVDTKRYKVGRIFSRLALSDESYKSKASSINPVKWSGSDNQFLRAACVMGIGPLSTGVPGLVPAGPLPKNLKMAGLDIEGTSFNRLGMFNLMSDPIISIAISTNFTVDLFIYTVGNLDERLMPNVVCVKAIDSTEAVHLAIEYLKFIRADFVAIHNGYAYDCKLMAYHCGADYESYFESVKLGALGRGMDLVIPGTIMIDTYFYLSKVHRNMYPGFSLNVLAQHLGLKSKMGAPSFNIDPLDMNYDISYLAEYNLHDSYLHWMVMDRTNCVPEILTLSHHSRSPVQDSVRFVTGTMITSCVSSHITSTDRMLLWEDHTVASENKFRGAVVLTPMIGLHQDILVADFASLYPSIILSGNISPDSVRSRLEFQGLKSERARDLDTLDWDRDGIVVNLCTGPCGYYSSPPGIVTEAVRKLVLLRSEVGKATCQGGSLKILANSCYGSLGSTTNPFYRVECAQTVTLVGRWLLSVAIVIFSLGGLEVIYGDTDSIFLKLKKRPDLEIKSRAAMVNEVFKYILSFTPLSHTKLELDSSVYKRMIIYGKKHYTGILESGRISSKGGAQVRKSTISIVRVIVKELTEIVLKEKFPRRACLDYLRRAVGLVVAGRIDGRHVCGEVKVDGTPCLQYKRFDGVTVKFAPDQLETQDIIYDVGYVLDRLQGALKGILEALGLPSVREIHRSRRFDDSI